MPLCGNCQERTSYPCWLLMLARYYPWRAELIERYRRRAELGLSLFGEECNAP